MEGICIGSDSGINLKFALRNLKSAIMLGALLLALSFPVGAQQPAGKVPRLG